MFDEDDEKRFPRLTLLQLLKAIGYGFTRIFPAWRYWHTNAETMPINAAIEVFGLRRKRWVGPRRVPPDPPSDAGSRDGARSPP